MNFASFKSAIGKAYETASTATVAISKDLQSQVVGARCLREYTLQGQVASGGLHGVWKIFSARSKKEGAQNKVVSAWILDKRPPPGVGGSGRWEAVIELCRKDAAALTRLKHPSIVKILEPMEETRTQLIMVTEAIFASSLDLLNKFEGLPGQRQAVRLSELDCKAGLLQVADGLQFLHHEANLVHRGLSPGVVLLTAVGAWKLAGLGLAVQGQFGNAEGAQIRPFDFSNSSPPLWLQLTQAPLGYVAPELTGYSSGAASIVTPAADIFSLGALVYELLSGKQLFDVGSNLASYQGKLASIHLMDLSGCPPQLLGTLKAMLSTQPSARPNANAFSGAPYFQEDVVIRALRFLEGFLQRDALQKAAFLKDLEGLWARCDARVLRYRVLPPLLGEARNEQLQPIILPLIMRIVHKQDSQDFSDYVLPSLLPVFASATGQALFQLTRFSDLLYQVMQPQHVEAVLIPLLSRAADHGDVRTQEEMLKKCQCLAEKADYSALKAQILPRASRLCLATTSAAVRQAAFQALTQLAPRFDKEVATGLVGTLHQVLKVDRSNGTVSAALALGDALVSAWGPIFGAECVMPVLCPCLAAPGLSRDQFRDVFKAIEGILGSIAASRVSNLDEEKAAIPSDPQALKNQPLPSWDTGPSTSFQPPEPSQPSTVRVPVPSRHDTGSSRMGASRGGMSKPTTPSTPPVADPFAPSHAPLQQAAAQADPFAIPLGGPAKKPMQLSNRNGNAGRAQDAALDLFSDMSLSHTPMPTASASREQDDPFADWPMESKPSRQSQPQQSGASAPMRPQAKPAAGGSASWQPSFPAMSSQAATQQSGLFQSAVPAAPKLTPPPRGRSGQTQQAAPPQTGTDSLI